MFNVRCLFVESFRYSIPVLSVVHSCYNLKTYVLSANVERYATFYKIPLRSKPTIATIYMLPTHKPDRLGSSVY